MRLSERLERVVSFVRPCASAADIGTDHALVPVELVRRGIVKKALAMDVRPGPLSRAKEQISRAGHTGKTTCCAIFQRYTGESPISYLTGYRLKKALELLENTDWTVAEICFASGFSSASYFAAAFRRCYGCTPTAYRARLRAEAACQTVLRGVY